MKLILCCLVVLWVGGCASRPCEGHYPITTAQAAEAQEETLFDPVEDVAEEQQRQSKKSGYSGQTTGVPHTSEKHKTRSSPNADKKGEAAEQGKTLPANPEAQGPSNKAPDTAAPKSDQRSLGSEYTNAPLEN